MKKTVFVSIIIVNFNGRQLLHDCLASLQKLTYSKNAFEIIVVDNNSTDDSVTFLLKNFPDVRVIQNSENGGFTGGNILGFSQARGEYIVMLNSDVVVDEQWLSALVRTAQDPSVGIVSSRLRYALPFFELVIDSAAVPKSKVFNTIDHSPIGALIEDIVCTPANLSSLVQYKSGFYDKKKGEIATRWTSGKSKVLLPFDPTQKRNEYILTLHGLNSTEDVEIPVNLTIGTKVIKKISLHCHEAQQVVLEIDSEDVKDSRRWLIQNAGNIILSTGYGKDRGNVIYLRDSERLEQYEEESDYFLQPSNLLGACGASMLVKREVIDQIGFLDGYYFMYYEDVEFSLRAWRAGWKIAYEPDSIGYHKHRATTGSEETSFFLHLVERNHLAFVMTHFPLQTVFSQFFYFSLRALITTFKYVVFQFLSNEARADVWRQKYVGRKDALFFLIRSLPRLLKTRIALNARSPMNSTKFSRMLY